jgi:hypothetical protein
MKDEFGSRRFYGIYRGVVVDNADPLTSNRLRVKVPQILGDTATGWAWAKEVPYIRNKPLPAGAPVWVMFEGGDPAYPVWVGTFGDNNKNQTMIYTEPLSSSSVAAAAAVSDLVPPSTGKAGSQDLNLTSALVATATQVTTNQSNIVTNTNDIQTNSDNIATNTQDILDLQAQVGGLIHPFLLMGA